MKLKIHYLEEALRKSGPGLNEAALKENTELKVTRVTMQKELHRYKKNLGQAEHDLEAYQSQFTDLKDKVKQKHADASLHEELENLKKAIEEKEHIIGKLKENLRAVEEQDVEAGKLRDEIEDLQADMGEKDRIIEEREEEIVRIICCPSIMDLTNCGDRTSSRSMLIRTQPLLQSWKSIWNPLRRKFKTFEIRLSMRNLKRQKHGSTARRRATRSSVQRMT